MGEPPREFRLRFARISRLTSRRIGCKLPGKSMKPTAVIGVILIILGVLALAYREVHYTKKETILNIGPIHAEADRQQTIPIPVAVGVAAMIGGVALLAVGGKK
jgi:uncharacterized membrane protein YidH (DUF202 family)